MSTEAESTLKRTLTTEPEHGVYLSVVKNTPEKVVATIEALNMDLKVTQTNHLILIQGSSNICSAFKNFLKGIQGCNPESGILVDPSTAASFAKTHENTFPGVTPEHIFGSFIKLRGQQAHVLFEVLPMIKVASG